MFIQRIKATRNAEAGQFIVSQAGGNIKVSADAIHNLKLEKGGDNASRLDVGRDGDNLFLIVAPASGEMGGYKLVETGHFNSKTVIAALGGDGKRYEIAEEGVTPENAPELTCYLLSAVESEEEVEEEVATEEER